MRFLRYSLRAALTISNAHLKSPRVKGFLGEREVRQVLKDEKFLLNNLVITNGVSTQIDHILINEKGIIVIETKNYRGAVKGGTKQKYWVQYINKRQFAFLNPLLQNAFHLDVLSKMYPAYQDYFVSVVVFTDQVKLLTSASNLIKLSELPAYLDKLPTRNLSEAEQEEIYTTIHEIKTAL